MNITKSQYRILKYFKENPNAIYQRRSVNRELSERLDLSIPCVWYSINKLIDDGYLTFNELYLDGKGYVSVELTKKADSVLLNEEGSREYVEEDLKDKYILDTINDTLEKTISFCSELKRELSMQRSSYSNEQILDIVNEVFDKLEKKFHEKQNKFFSLIIWAQQANKDKFIDDILKDIAEAKNEITKKISNM